MRSPFESFEIVSFPPEGFFFLLVFRLRGAPKHVVFKISCYVLVPPFDPLPELNLRGASLLFALPSFPWVSVCFEIFLAAFLLFFHFFSSRHQDFFCARLFDIFGPHSSRSFLVPRNKSAHSSYIPFYSFRFLGGLLSVYTRDRRYIPRWFCFFLTPAVSSHDHLLSFSVYRAGPLFVLWLSFCGLLTCTWFSIATGVFPQKLLSSCFFLHC